MIVLHLFSVIVFLIASVHIAGSCTYGEYDKCPNWDSCSKGCGGGRQCRTCESCAWSIDKRFCQNCNEFCYNGHSFQNGGCQCPSWRSSECCEGCRNIYIPHCVGGQQQCGGSPDGIMCTQCERGFLFREDTNQGCLDTDECASGTSGCAQQCTNTQGSYVCSCLSGYWLWTDKHTCKDTDECAAGTSGCAQQCINTQGSYVCSCLSGYWLWTDTHTCKDTDECAAGTSGCAQQCTNTQGSYVCSCLSGYWLWTDKHTCNYDNCTFESHSTCAWTDVTSGDGFDWTLTYGTKGKYMYIGTSGTRQTGDRAWLISPLLPCAPHAKMPSVRVQHERAINWVVKCVHGHAW